MKIVRVRVAGWAIRNSKGLWLDLPTPWTYIWVRNHMAAHVFKRLSEAEKWIAENS